MFRFQIESMVLDPYSHLEISYIVLPSSRFARQLVHTRSQNHRTQYIVHQHEDSEHAELLLLLTKVAHLAGDKDRRLKNENMREGTRLDAPTVP